MLRILNSQWTFGIRDGKAMFFRMSNPTEQREGIKFDFEIDELTHMLHLMYGENPSSYKFYDTELKITWRDTILFKVYQRMGCDEHCSEDCPAKKYQKKLDAG